jgi:hypothetical protein
MVMTEPAAYLHLLLAGNVSALARRFAAGPVIDDPRAGPVEGNGALEAFVVDTSAWMQERQAKIEPVAEVTDGRRTVSEAVLHLNLLAGPVGLPVAVATERTDDGTDRWLAVRVYHSLWPLIGAHRVRSPLLTPDPAARLTGAVAEYQQGLATGDIDRVLGAFAADAIVREPAGGEYEFRGAGELRRIYGLMFADGGGIPLRYCTVTDDGTACAIEYNVQRWGAAALPPQCGIAVYVRGAEGRLVAARIYDDVEPPPASDSSRQA